MIGVKKISHATYETPDLDRQIEYYTDVLGLTLTAREKDAAFLASTLDHHSVVLRKGDHSSCVRIGFQVGPDDDLAAFEKQTAAHGIKTERKSNPEPTIAEMVTFEDPKGTMMEVFKRADVPPQKFSTKGIVPHKLGHVAFFVKDVKKTTDFYCNVLGFRVSDWMGDFFSFLRCGTDHHTNGYKLLWGPGRHGIGHNLFTYHRAPNGLITELFAQLDQMNEQLGYFEPRPWHRDRPQKPKVWAKDPNAANYWGIMPGDEMHK